jgi:signal transduction histidine kinase
MTRIPIAILQRKIMMLAIVAVFLTGVLVSLAGIWPLTKTLQSSARDTLAQVHAAQKISLAQYLHSLSDTARQVANRTALRKALAQQARGLLTLDALEIYSRAKLEDALNSSTSLRMIARYDRTGQLVVRVGEELDQRKTIDFPALLQGSDDQLWIGAPVLDTESGFVLVAHAITAQTDPAPPQDASSRQIVGYDLLAFGISDLASILAQHSGKTSPFQTIVGVKSAQSSPNGSWFWLGSQPQDSQTTSLAPRLQRLESRPEFQVVDDQNAQVTQWEQWAVAHGPIQAHDEGTIGGPQWYLLVTTSVATLSEPIQKVLLRTGSIMLILMTVVGVGLWLLLRPLQGRLMVRTHDLESQVTQLKTLGDELALERERLRQSNQELEQFAYAASHDLQQPLRMVSGFLTALERQYADKLDDTAKEFIGFAVDGAQRMRAMITDLLDYSRVGRLESSMGPVDLNQTLDRAQQMLALAIAETGAKISVGPLPTVQAVAPQMGRLFQNLIDNALKYAMPGRPPEITISAEKQAEGWLIKLADNGIGIDAKSLERAFQLFQRLHPEMDCQGTGMGLAMCAKIVSRHNGRIWLESEPEQGTTVCISLPEVKADGDAKPSQD